MLLIKLQKLSTLYINVKIYNGTKMIIKLFTIYDSKADAYLAPIHMQTTGQALRAFQDTVLDPTHAFSKHPEDYSLFSVGQFDDSNCKFDLLPTPICIAKAIEYTNPLK